MGKYKGIVSQVWLNRAKRYGRTDQQILGDAEKYFDLSLVESRRRLRRAGVNMSVHKRMTRRSANARFLILGGMVFCILLVLFAAAVAYLAVTQKLVAFSGYW
jgi:hypothetical protein